MAHQVAADHAMWRTETLRVCIMCCALRARRDGTMSFAYILCNDWTRAMLRRADVACCSTPSHPMAGSTVEHLAITSCSRMCIATECARASILSLSVAWTSTPNVRPLYWMTQLHCATYQDRATLVQHRAVHSSWRPSTMLGCDIHTHAHAQDSLYNKVVQQHSTAGSLCIVFRQGHGYEHHSSYVA